MRLFYTILVMVTVLYGSVAFAVTCTNDGSTSVGLDAGHIRQLKATMDGTANCVIMANTGETPTIRISSSTGVYATGGVASFRSKAYLPGNTSITLSNYTIDGNPVANSYTTPYETTIGSTHVIVGEYTYSGVKYTANATITFNNNGNAGSITYTSSSVTILNLDSTAPRITSITRNDPTTSPTANDTVKWRVTFDEDVQNVTNDDFTITGTTAALAVNAVSATVYDVTASGGDLANLNATITLGFAGGQNIEDTASNALANTTPTGTNNNTFAILNDATKPSVQIQDAPSSLVNQEAFNTTYEFSEDVTGFVVGDITITNGTASNFVAVDGNTYTADITPSGAGNLKIDVAAGVSQDAASNTNTAATQVLVTCGAGCGEIATIAKTQQVLQNYAGARIRQMTAQGPAIGEFLSGDGMNGSLNGFIESPLHLNVNGDNSDNNSGSFSTSFQQLAKFSHNLKANNNNTTMDNPISSPANVWVKGRRSKINDDRGGINDETDFGIIYLGADYRFTDDLLIGVLGQYDWFDSSSQGLGSQAEGDGWMIGPYIVSRLKDSLIMDLRVAWGQSDNKVNPIGTYWDDYDGERWQVGGSLTGDLNKGRWNIAPTVGLNYFKDIQEKYTDNNGFTISEQSTGLGTLSFGPKMTYLADGYDGSRVHPFVTVKGVWDFTAPDIYDVSGIASGTEKLRAQLGFGASVIITQGTNVQVSYTYDGIGINDYESHTADLSAHISLTNTGLPKGSSLSASYLLQNVLMLQSEESQGARLELTIPFN